MFRKLLTFVAVFTLSFGLIHCGGDDDNSNNATGTTYAGAVAFDSGEDGTIEISLPETLGKLSPFSQTSNDVAITGECIYPNNSVDLEGTIDSETGDFTLTGGDFTFIGTFDFSTGTFTGSVTGTGGETGSFTGIDNSDGDVQLFCGTYVAGDSGVWVLVVTNDLASGSYAGSFDAGNLSGTRDGDTITVTSSEGGGAEGTISGNTVSGVILNETGDEEGTFEGSTSGCE